MIGGRPSAFTKQDIQERKSITTLRSILSPGKILPFFSEGDKTPDTDGYLIILDDDYTPIAKIEVQIKKLPKKHQKNPRYKCKTSLFDYAHHICMRARAYVSILIHSANFYSNVFFIIFFMKYIWSTNTN